MCAKKSTEALLLLVKHRKIMECFKNMGADKYHISIQWNVAQSLKIMIKSYGY